MRVFDSYLLDSHHNRSVFKRKKIVYHSLFGKVFNFKIDKTITVISLFVPNQNIVFGKIIGIFSAIKKV